MIWVCDPLSHSFSHEKVNSGMLYSLSLAFPHEEIIFVASASHVRSIQNILKLDQVKIENLRYKEFPFKKANTLYSFFCSFFQQYQILSKVVRSGENRIVFLAYSAPILWILKKYRSIIPRFQNLNFLIVLHGSFEYIAPPKSFVNTSPVSLINPGASGFISKVKKAASAGVVSFFNKILHRLSALFVQATTIWPRVASSIFVERKVVENENRGFRYLALSPHIVENAYQILDKTKVDIRSIFLPTVFVDKKVSHANSKLKVATFGYGNSKILAEVAHHITSLTKNFNFEIRIIGMDDRGSQGYSFISTPSPGKALRREQMEDLAQDIDFFLILYENNRYRLSCSGSIFEALSYRKPIIHLDNECINFFNSSENPIGIKCDNSLEVARVIVNLAENLPATEAKAHFFRKNIETLRDRVCIEKNFKSLIEALAF